MVAFACISFRMLKKHVLKKTTVTYAAFVGGVFFFSKEWLGNKVVLGLPATALVMLWFLLLPPFGCTTTTRKR